MVKTSSSPPSYTISYNANVGSSPPNAQTKTQGISMTLSNSVPIKNGYNFSGWGLGPTSSASYYPGGTFSRDSSNTLYAIWLTPSSISTGSSDTYGTLLNSSRSQIAYNDNDCFYKFLLLFHSARVKI